jgi:hypothetical protein
LGQARGATLQMVLLRKSWIWNPTRMKIINPEPKSQIQRRVQTCSCDAPASENKTGSVILVSF